MKICNRATYIMKAVIPKASLISESHFNSENKLTYIKVIEKISGKTIEDIISLVSSFVEKNNGKSYDIDLDHRSGRTIFYK